MARRVLNGHRLGAARNQADKSLIHAEACGGDSIGLETFRRDEEQRAALQSEIDGADICHHGGSDQADDLVEPRPCFAFLRHNLAEPVHQQARRGQIIRHGQPVCRSLYQAASRPNAVWRARTANSV